MGRAVVHATDRLAREDERVIELWRWLQGGDAIVPKGTLELFDECGRQALAGEVDRTQIRREIFFGAHALLECFGWFVTVDSQQICEDVEYLVLTGAGGVVVHG
jgi:hypothetical protein